MNNPTARPGAKELREHGSSVLCQGKSNIDRRCVFHNLCYHPSLKDFVFLHSSHSIYEGIPEDRQQPALVDLSSVMDHNTQYFDYVDVASFLRDFIEECDSSLREISAF